jgi:hypothetical protein
MWKILFSANTVAVVLALIALVLLGWPSEHAPDPEIPTIAETTLAEDYLEWIHPPRLAGPCEELPVIKVEWITPRGVSGKRPVVWLKADDKFAAILGLTDAQADWIGGTVLAQSLMVLRDVSIYRLCRQPAITPW